jgi:hypothetical protein
MALANTASLSTNFNVDPYYDDFDETKNFHRVLFRPGLAVQARELTQMQTIQQNQIDRFAEHIFKEGSTVRGLEMNYDSSIDYIKIRDDDENTNPVDVSLFKGTTITGATSSVTAEVIDSLTGSETDTNTKVLYVKYTNSGANNTTKTLLSGEKFTTGALSANVITEGVQSTNVIGKGSRITFGDGILYAKDHFIRVDTQSTIVGRYSANTSVKVGFDIVETIVNSGADTTLLDPAQGAYNYAAPGADRLKLTATIAKKELTDTSTDNFVERIRIQNGVPQYKFDKPLYSIINDYIARRTSDESGDYIVSGLNVRLREHLNDGSNQGYLTLAKGGTANSLSVGIGPGKAYVKGYENELYRTDHIKIDKGVDTEDVGDLSIPANYGNYVVVNEAVGSWDLNGHDRVSLYDTLHFAISNTHFSSTAPSGSKIGEARVRAMEYASGTKGAPAGQYNLYLYDINMWTSDFSSVRSVYYDNGAYDAFADIVLEGGNAVLKETSFNRSLFAIPASNIKRLRDSTGTIDNTFRFLREFDVTIAADGTVTIPTGASSEVYPFSTGLLNNTQERDNFHVVLQAAATSAAPVDSGASKTAGSDTISGITSGTTKYNVGDAISIAGIANTLVVTTVGTTTLTVNNTFGTGSGDVTKSFQPGQVISLNGVGGDSAERSVNINSSTSATIDIQETLGGTVNASVFVELSKTDGQEIDKNLNPDRYVELNVSAAFANTNLGSPGLAGPWNLGFADIHELKEVRVKTGNTSFATTGEGTDVTNQFEIDTGMRDNLYNHGKLKLKTSASHVVANGNVYLAKFDYFSHDTSAGVGYFSVDSYPVNDTSPTSSQIRTEEIPVYTSPVTGARYDLRNYVDIRPRITDTATDTTTLTGITTNPATANTVVEPSGGLRYMAPNEDFITDFEYYLSRKDRVVITSKGQIRVVRGVPSLNPQTPKPASDGLTLAIIDVAPYPSLPFENAKRVSTATAPNGRTDLANTITPVRQVRHTMRDIGVLKNRIENLEYYTSLSLLEADTKSTFLADGSGNDRFKNGILVDAFTGHSIGNVFNPDYNIAVDPQKNELRPPFKLDDVQVEFNSASSSGVSVKSKDATVTIADSTQTYTVGETVTCGAGTGKLVYQVDAKLYLEQVSGTLSGTAVGGDSGASSSISSVTLPDNSKLITLPYNHDLVINQSLASTTRNTAGTFYNYHGNLELTPETDYWVDTTVRPEVQIDFDFNTQAWQNLANAWGTQFGDWNTIWTGGTTETRVNNIINGGNLRSEQITSTTTVGQQRQGLRAEIGVPQTQTQSIGESVRDVNLIPFMRSRVINFTVTGMKPSTRVYAFFDSEDVNAYVTPTDSSFVPTASEGSNLVTDANGVLYGNFRIPNNDTLRFRVGTLLFKLVDSATGSEDTTATTTWASANYSASGLSQVVQDTVIGTRNVSIEFNTVTETRTTSSSSTRFELNEIPDFGEGNNTFLDPIAQTFIVDTSDNFGSGISSGVYLTKLDLYFSSKDANLPVDIEIREVDPSTSLITKKVVPFGKQSVASADVNTSTDASKPTPIVFDTPVFLLNDTEYAIVIKPGGNNPNYTVFTARLGEDDLTTGNRIVSQPYSGILFASANDRIWTAIQEEDLKFKMYFGNFGTSQSGTAVFKNTDKEYLTVNTLDSTTMFNVVGESVHGETTLTLAGTLAGAIVGDTLVGATSSANGTISDISGTNYRVKEVTTANKFTNTETITLYQSGAATGTTSTLSSQATPTGKVYFYDGVTAANNYLHLSEPSGTFVAGTQLRTQTGGLDANIVSIDDLQIDIFHTHMSKLDLQGTESSITGKLATGTTTLDSVYRNVNDNGDTEYDTPRYVASKSNETTNHSGSKTVDLKVALSNSTNKRHSPAIDNERAALFTVENLVNNDSTNENSTFGGNATAKYITRTVTLADGQDAEDLKIFLTAYKPGTSDIQLYYKILNVEDSDTLDDQSWTQMTQTTSAVTVSDSENRNDLKEYEYNIPAANLTGTGGEVQYVNSESVTYTGFKYFAIKIVLLSSTTSNVPRVRDFRAIALQI